MANSTLKFMPPTRTTAEQAKTLKAEDFKSSVKPDWCPSCGDYGVLNSLQKACSEAGLQPKDILAVSGIGCSSNLPGFLNSYGIHSLHGRAMAVASGAKLANPDLTVLVTGGDGDGYGIGLGHFVHAMRRNIDVTYIVMNNQIYGLTTGQASPTTSVGMKTKSTPEGDIENPINPIALALISGATFIARAYSGDPSHMAETMKKAIQHKGFSLVDCFSPCVTYNKLNTYQWFRQAVYRLEDEKHKTSDFNAAMTKALQTDKLPIGVFYERTDLPTYEELDPTIKKYGAVVKLPLGLSSEEQEAIVQSFY
jgi:2-oxoglutarate ferredoxin oxidoreductase subunit beta